MRECTKSLTPIAVPSGNVTPRYTSHHDWRHDRWDDRNDRGRDHRGGAGIGTTTARVAGRVVGKPGPPDFCKSVEAASEFTPL